jgi:uncharacterized protein (DUF1501 family)
MTQKDNYECAGSLKAEEMMRRSRRQFMAGLMAAPLVASLAPYGISMAAAPTDKRLVVVILRGGMDGLAATIPHGDPDYEELRGKIAFEAEDALNLDGYFALHPSFKTLNDLYRNREMAIIHAVASPYRKRSHFDAQNVLELGGTAPYDRESGWMNRLVKLISDKSAAESADIGMAFGQSIPVAMRGQTSVGSWAPSTLPDVNPDFYDFVSHMYQNDPSLNDNLKKGLKIQDTTDMLFEDESRQSMNKMARQSRNNKGFVTLANVTGEWMSKQDGPRIATLELGGWDSHVNQGLVIGRLANNFKTLDDGVAALKQSLGNEVWSKTVVMAVTEFGRTAAPNGNNGTDHGTAGCAFLMGGAVKGGRVITDWPGLSKDRLYEGRDLRPTYDLRSVFKGVLSDHLGLSLAQINAVIYPDSASALKMNGLVS